MKLINILIGIILLMYNITLCKAVETTVVAQQNVPDVNVTTIDLIQIFTRKKLFWSDGHKIKVYIKQSDSIEHKLFTINVLNISPYKYKSLLDSVVYSGYNTSVTEVSSDEEMTIKISNTPYSIGYLNYNTVIANNSSNIITIHYD